MKKEILAMLMVVIILLSLSGCVNSATAAYKTIAQSFVDDGNIETAKKTLEKGIADTKSKDLQAMLDSLSNADLSEHDGVWAEEDLNYENGGLIMSVSTFEGATLLTFEHAEESVGYANGLLEHYVLKNEVDSSTITIKKAMDIYENLIDMTVSFNDDTVTCEIINIEEMEISPPLLKKRIYKLVRTEDAYSILSEDQRSDATGIKTDRFTDTSKASGILAQLEMTEEEFRASCQPLLNYDRSNQGCRTTQELLDFPSKYIGEHFTLYDPFDEDKLSTMHISSKGTSTQGRTTYADYTSIVRGTDIIVFDYRDDIYSPTISITDNIYPYMIFQGLRTNSSGRDYLCFQLISVDKE